MRWDALLCLQVNLAKMVAKQPGPPIEINTMTDLFLQRNAVREATAFLLDALQDNKPEQAQLQTKVCRLPPALRGCTVGFNLTSHTERQNAFLSCFVSAHRRGADPTALQVIRLSCFQVRAIDCAKHSAHHASIVAHLQCER